MNTWLLKSEPDVYSFSDLTRDGATRWVGIRNYQAANFLKAMQVGDCAFIYHTGGERRIMGTATITRTAYPDPGDADGVFVCVDLKVEKPFKTPVTLEFIKQSGLFPDFLLLKQGRLSAVPVPAPYAALLRQAGH